MEVAIRALKTCSTVDPEFFWKKGQIRKVTKEQSEKLLKSIDFELFESKSVIRRKKIQNNSLNSKKYEPTKKK